MPVFLLDNDLFFPDPHEASNEGLLAVGGTLSEDRLLLAYQMGIFPWYNAEDPILWWSPDPRCVLYIDKLKVSKSMRNVINQNKYTCTFDRSFEEVMRGCMTVKRADQGTWITEDIIHAYVRLHQLGVAHSVEVWDGDVLVGGLYGISMGNMFFGESMFSKKSNASKLAFIILCGELKKKGFKMIDCQIYNPHLGSLGAENISRKKFLKILELSLEQKSLVGSWAGKFDF